MVKSVSITALILLAALVVSLFYVPLLGLPTSYSSIAPQPTSSLQPQVNNVLVNMTIVPLYTIMDLNGLSPVNVSITMNQLTSSAYGSRVEIVTTFKPLGITAEAFVANSTVPITLPPSALGTTAAIARTFTIRLPVNVTSATISFRGDQSGESILGRYATTLPIVFVQGPVNFTHTFNVFAPVGSVLSQTYGGYSASTIEGSTLEPNPVPTTIGTPVGSELYYIPTGYTTLIFQPSWFAAASFVLLGLAAILVAVVAMGFFAKGRAMRSRVFGTITGPLVRVWRSISRFVSPPRKGKLLLLSSKKLLVLFLACGVLMVALASLSGPDPTYKVYAVATPAEIPQLQSQIQNIVGGNVQMITPQEDYNDFQVMSNVGTFNMVIVSQYTSLQLQSVNGSILPYLGNVPIVIVDNQSDPTFAYQIKSLYPSETISIGNAGNLNSTEVSTISLAINLNLRHNFLGLQVSSSGFKEIIVAEGGLSFLIFFFGAMFLGAKIAEPDEDRTLFRVATVAMYGIFVFYFTEVIYVVTSATLAFPLSLHAVVSGATSITAVGLFGQVVHLPIGGGTTPRLISGAIGFFIGAYNSGSGRVFNKYSIALISGLFVILVFNPLGIGVFFYQVILFFIGSIATGFVASSANTFKTFLYGFGFALGGDASTTLILSAGKILYFAALVPLGFIKKMGKSTASLTLLMTAVLIGDGGVRIGEMTPDKTEVAVIPGVVAGITITGILLLISFIEKYLVTNYSRSRS